MLEQAVAQAKQHFTLQVAADWTKSLPQMFPEEQYLRGAQMLTIWLITTKTSSVSTAAPIEDNVCFIHAFPYSF